MDPLLTEIEPSVAQEDEEHSGGYYRFVPYFKMGSKCAEITILIS